MRVDLTELLRQKPIVHKTKIVSATISPGSLRLVVLGYPWWRGSTGKQDDYTIEFLFEGVTEGCLRIDDVGGVNDDWDEALEVFEVYSVAELDWAQPNIFSIFCSSALKSPLNLYLRLHDFLKEVDAYRGVEDFLNFPSGRLAQFVEITSSNSFLVATGPECVRRVICSELEQQGVAYNVITKSIAPNRYLLVRLADSHFLCSAAYAEFDEL
jgi:hypothetical protein